MEVLISDMKWNASLEIIDGASRQHHIEMPLTEEESDIRIDLNPGDQPKSWEEQ